nr:MAG TPA: hypothetical protein [Caudoviricetes sp.]
MSCICNMVPRIWASVRSFIGQLINSFFIS